MSELINIINRVPDGACPVCGKQQFVIVESIINDYLTNRDGEVIDVCEYKYYAEGICCNCENKIQMKPTNNGFIPMTPLRLMMNKTMCNHSIISSTINPMQKELIKNES